jgi:protein required for attachment to host cells
MQVPHKGVVLVADGKKMLFFRNEGDEAFPKLQVEDKDTTDQSADNQNLDGAGQAFASSGHGGQSHTDTDSHQLEEDRFAADTAEMLKRRALRNDYDALIVVAPPRTLGELRKHYHKEVERRLAGEIAKDLTGHPVAEIEKILLSQ